ncbi:MAG: PIN domain-containing protein [Candidatus Sumerlaeota bacterium]|nr:PIN domain-containing protein [Candidatus Sumerlaeota bacterium]
MILGRCEAGDWQWVSSDVVEEEIANTPDPERRRRVESILAGAGATVALTQTATARAQQLHAMGFGTYDSLHLACAEAAKVDLFLTTDDRILRVATRHSRHLRLRVANPLECLLGER